MAKIIATDKAPSAIGPYSQAMVIGNMVFTSGQIAIDPCAGDIVAKDVAGQTEQVMKNLEAVLAAAGTSMAKAVKTTCFLADIADFAVFNEVYGRYFTSKP
ncbi:MAG: regulator, partial [Clostridia bacterium]|nr:regulator [Clostridia bacterium]